MTPKWPKNDLKNTQKHENPPKSTKNDQNPIPRYANLTPKSKNVLFLVLKGQKLIFQTFDQDAKKSQLQKITVFL